MWLIRMRAVSARGAVQRILAVMVIAVVALGGLVLLLEEKLIYFPHRDMERTPRELGLDFEDIYQTAEDQVRIHGWYFPVTGSGYTVLICHGNAGNISHRLDRVLLMESKLQTSLLLFDYRGYGQSEGSPDEAGTYRDARAAYRYLVTEHRVPAERIILFGESLGGAIALQLALEVPARALVVESTFTSLPDVARAHYPFLPVERLLKTRYDNASKISRLSIPLLVIHGTRDRTVPFEQGRRLYEAAPEPKRFLAIEGAGHNDTFIAGAEAYWSAWKSFLERLAS